MAVNTGKGSRAGSVSERAQLQNPITGKFIKLDTSTGRILAEKKTEGPYKGVRDITKKKPKK